MTEDFDRDEKGSIIMNQYNLDIIIRKDGLYDLPDLNNKLYLHFKGFRKIQNLQQFKNLKTLWLENNLIEKIEGLENLTELINLFLQNNLIIKIEGLENNINLVNLNLMSNRIRKIENIKHLNKLGNLNIASNKLEHSSDIEEIIYNQTITTLDISNNFFNLEDSLENKNFMDGTTIHIDPLLKVLIQLQDIRQRYQKDRLLSQKYIGFIQSLTYLDQKPVTYEERLLAESFVGEGQTGEYKQREILKQENIMKKIQDSAKIRKTIPQHTLNKISLFEKQIDTIQHDIEQLNELKINKINDNNTIQYINNEIERKEKEKEDINQLLVLMKQRVGTKTYNSDISEYNSESVQSQEENKNQQQQKQCEYDLDELD